MNGLKKKRWFRHAVKYYLAIKMNELLIHVIKNQYQNIILFTYHSPNTKINREEELISGCQGLVMVKQAGQLQRSNTRKIFVVRW